MRAFITFLTSVSVATLLALDNPEGFRNLSATTRSMVNRLWNEKEIRIDGLGLLSRAEVEKLLPLDQSVAWWHFNVTALQAALAQNPWIAGAKVSACPDSWASRWGCFLLQIQERSPTFLATFEGNSWVIGQDGAFLVPLSELQSRNFSGKLVQVSGISANANAPDLVRSQLAVASRLCTTLEKQVARRVESLEFLGQGDFAIGFQGVPFPVVFAAGEEAKVPLVEQGQRCSALLKQLSSRLSQVERIDLAFDRVGVVKLKPTLEPAKGS